jgi:hypothetical protein
VRLKINNLNISARVTSPAEFIFMNTPPSEGHPN